MMESAVCLPLQPQEHWNSLGKQVMRYLAKPEPNAGIFQESQLTDLFFWWGTPSPKSPTGTTMWGLRSKVRAPFPVQHLDRCACHISGLLQQFDVLGQKLGQEFMWQEERKCHLKASLP